MDVKEPDVLCITFHAIPEHGQGMTPIVPHCSVFGSCPGTAHRQCDYTITPSGVQWGVRM